MLQRIWPLAKTGTQGGATRSKERPKYTMGLWCFICSLVDILAGLLRLHGWREKGCCEPRVLQEESILAHSCYNKCLVFRHKHASFFFLVFNFSYLFFEDFMDILNVFSPYLNSSPALPRSLSSPFQLLIFFFFLLSPLSPITSVCMHTHGKAIYWRLGNWGGT